MTVCSCYKKISFLNLLENKKLLDGESNSAPSLMTFLKLHSTQWFIPY